MLRRRDTSRLFLVTSKVDSKHPFFLIIKQRRVKDV
jgi:hypothetical protein